MTSNSIPMRPLNPTLWRTCRVLAGRTRLQLFRLVVNSPGSCVTTLADEAGIGMSRASQELRRLQSRGMLRAERIRNRVLYAPAADPQVTGAQALLDALTETFARFPPGQDAALQQMASGLSHPRRIAILQRLLEGPQTPETLASSLGIPLRTVYRQLTRLEQGRWIRHQQGVCRVRRQPHPLARCLTELVRQPRTA